MTRTAFYRLLLSQSKHLTSPNFNPVYNLGRLGACSNSRCGIWHLGSSVQLFVAQQRWASSRVTAVEDDSKISIGPRQSEDEDKQDKGIVYYGPISSTIKKVKLLSLSTCGLSVSLGPIITFMTCTQQNVILRGTIATAVIFLSASTTAALHWFVNPYIHKLRWLPGSDSFEVEMLSWMASHIPRTIKFADIQPPETQRPFVTFQANGSFYFVDEDHCDNKALMAKLTPRPKSAKGSSLKNV